MGKAGKRCDLFATVRGFRDLAVAEFFDDVDADDRVHWQISAAYPSELGFKAFFGRVDYHRAFFAKHDFLDFNKSEQAALIHVACIDLVNLTLIVERYSVGVFALHGDLSACREEGNPSTCPPAAFRSIAR